MEEEKTVPATSEPNPNGNENVDPSDLEDEENEGQQNQKDPKSEEEGKTQQAKTKQDRKTDAEYAEERRKRKAREEARQKEREEEIRRQAVFEVKSSQVTPDELAELGIPKVSDEDQMFLVESLRKAKSDGDENPVASAYRKLFRKQHEEKAAEEEKAKAKKAEDDRLNAIVAKDQANFKAKFGKTTADVLKNEPDFVNSKYYKYVYEDKGNFTQAYTDYLEEAQERAKIAKREGSFPLNGKTSGNEEGDKKPKTLAEFDAYWDKKYNS